MTTELIGFSTMGICLVAIVTFTLRNAREEANKRQRIYARLDEQKEEVAKTYMRTDIHDVKYESLEKTVNEMRDDIKILLGRHEDK